MPHCSIFCSRPSAGIRLNHGDCNSKTILVLSIIVLRHSKHCPLWNDAPENLRLDGKSQGCRALHHAVFASVNAQHCPHLSFAPQFDVNGKIKCQTVGNIQPQDLFTADELAKFVAIELAAGIDPTTGIKIVDPTPARPLPCGLLGLGVFCWNGCGFFGWLLGLCATV